MKIDTAWLLLFSDYFTLHVRKAGTWTSQLHKSVMEETKSQQRLAQDNPTIQSKFIKSYNLDNLI